MGSQMQTASGSHDDKDLKATNTPTERHWAGVALTPSLQFAFAEDSRCDAAAYDRSFGQTSRLEHHRGSIGSSVSVASESTTSTSSRTASPADFSSHRDCRKTRGTPIGKLTAPGRGVFCGKRRPYFGPLIFLLRQSGLGGRGSGVFAIRDAVYPPGINGP